MAVVYCKAMEGNKGKHTLGKADVVPLAGMALLWFSVHVSPYYPFSLSPQFDGANVGAVSAQHMVYSIMLVLFLAIAIVLRGRMGKLDAHLPVIRAVAGVAGLAGSVMLFCSPLFGTFSEAASGVAISLVALYVAVFSISWFAFASAQGIERSVMYICLSYCLFSLLWSLLLIIGNGALALFSCACPALSAICFAFGPRRAYREPASHSFASLKVLPWGVLALCAVFIYFGVVAVRAFTTMGTGVSSAGSLGLMPQLVTALAGLAVTGFLAGLFARKGMTFSNVVTAIAVLTLVYMGALLMVTLGDPAGDGVLVCKRILVAAEHGVEVLLAATLAYEAARRRLSAPLVFGLFGIVVLAVPQFIALDVMYRSGVLGLLAELPLVTPVAATGAFAAAAVGIGVLVSFSRRMATQAEAQGDSWQENLCREATGAFDITQRELDVVVYTYRGYSAKKIAEALIVSESTVKAHLSHVYRKLGIHSKQELIALIDGYRVQ